MEVPELNLNECESVFIRDEFYENIQAPKYHDFCSAEEPLSDADAYFRRLGGRSPRQSRDAFADQNAFKGAKDAPVVLKPPGLPKAPLSSMALNADAQRASAAAGSKKVKQPTVSSMLNLLTKSQDKAPSSKIKTFQRVNPPSSNSVSPSLESDIKGNDHTSSITEYSENSDPNGSSQGKRKVTNLKSNEATILTVTTISTKGLVETDTKFQSLIPRPQRDKDKSDIAPVAGKVAAEETLEVKDRKRFKPLVRNGDSGGVLKAPTELKSCRVSKQKRKSEVSELSEPGNSSSKFTRVTSGEPATQGSISKAAAARRGSDNSRRRKASPKQGRRALPTKSVAAASGTKEVKVAQFFLPSRLQFGSIKVPISSVDPNLGLNGSSAFATSIGTATLVTETRNVEGSEGADTSNSGVGNGEHHPVEVSSGPVVIHDGAGRSSVGDSLLEKLQNLRLQQERTLEERGSTTEVTNTDELKDPLSTQIEGAGKELALSKETPEDVTRGDDLEELEQKDCIGMDSAFGELESGLGISIQAVPDQQDSMDNTMSLESGLPLDERPTSSEESMVDDSDQSGIIDSLQNLKIQHSSQHGTGTSDSQLPRLEDIGGTSAASLSLVKEDRPEARDVGGRVEEAGPEEKQKIVPGNPHALNSDNRSRPVERLESREAHGSGREVCKSRGPHFFMDNQQKRNNKRKSIELGPQRVEQRPIIPSSSSYIEEQRKPKGTSQSSLAPPLSLSQQSSTAGRAAVPVGNLVQHKKMKTTCPQPFRLRTEERGALKEVEFNKKVEQYLLAKEKMQNASFQFTTNKDERAQRKPAKESRTAVKQVHQHTQTGAAERAQMTQVNERQTRTDEEKQERDKRQQHNDEEAIRKLRKQMVPCAQKMPFFDRPFKPHRSTKSLTIPSSPKFHTLKGKKPTARPPSTQE